MNKINTVIVDDHPLVLEGMAGIISGMENFQIVGEFKSKKELLKFLKKGFPELILLDINLPDGNGINICQKLKKNKNSPLVVMLTNIDEKSVIQQCISNGADGYILKSASPDNIRSCVKEVIKGNQVFSTEILDKFTKRVLNEDSNVPRLTRREKEILILLAKGKSSDEISVELFISSLTVKTHRNTLLKKFNTNNIIKTIELARKYRILKD